MLLMFLVILIDLIGFGIMVPILAYYVVNLGGGPEMATFCMALYAVGMFIATPVLGRVSDYFGRKPVLMLSMLGASVAYIVLGFAESLLVVALSRLFAGLMAGNLAAAQAYIADITSVKNRAKGMGAIGAAFGLGFIIGPALGSYLAGDSFEKANLFLPAMVSAALSGSAFLVIVFFLPESLSDAHRLELRQQKKSSQLQAFKRVTKNQFIALLLIAAIFYNLAAGFVEGIFPLWVKDTAVAYGPKDLMPLLLAAGILMSIVQGGLIGPLTRKFGEQKLLQTGSLLFMFSTIGTVFSGLHSHYYGVMFSLCVQAVAAALIITSMQSLVSICAAGTERGMVLGIYSSAGTFGRIVGTIFTGIVFANIHIHSPYVLAAMATLLLFILTVSRIKQASAVVSVDESVPQYSNSSIRE